ncbi:MAG: flagellar hook protein FlgE [Bacillota bacterium]
MMRSLFAGVSGLRNHQIRMDVIGNNIANVNTMGFKAGRVSFQEVFNQTIRGASSALGNRGGTNPQQVGLGMNVGSIDTLQTQGNLQLTGKMTDMAIQGNGFFVLNSGAGLVYGRAGNFDLDANGWLTNPGNGMKVMGWMANTNGVLPVTDESNLSELRIPVGQPIAGKATTQVVYSQNLDSRTAAGSSWVTSVGVYDEKGATHAVTVTFTRTGTPNQWDWSASGTGVTGSGIVTFNPDGSYASMTGGPIVVDLTAEGTTDISFGLDLGRMTQGAEPSTASAVERDGYPMGSLETFTIDASGTITGVFSNGLNQKLGQIAVCSFSNPGGLLRQGDNVYVESNNSGLRQIGQAGTGGRGIIAPGSLEMSNVDLSLQFTDMIITQRGFQANSRIITTSDEMLQELVNLKR